MEETKTKTFDELSINIDGVLNKYKAESKLHEFRFCLNGNEIDVIKLAIKYNLKFSDEYSLFESYSLFKEHPLYPDLNTFIMSQPSHYGHVIYRFNINNIFVSIYKNQRTSYEKNFTSTQINKYDNSKKYVVLDIETTGLDPLRDDIIQICIYERNHNKYVRYLPLTKRNTNTARHVNHILDSTLQDKNHLTQNEVNEIIRKFDIQNKIVMIWTGKNLFDRLFLEIYFREHNLTGLEFFNFFNAKQLLDEIKDEISVKDLTKDHIANVYDISTQNAHDALEDCKIEDKIIEQLLNKNFQPLYDDKIKEVVLQIKDFLIHRECVNIPMLADNSNSENIMKRSFKTLQLQELYASTINAFKSKYGVVFYDYDDADIRKKGKEWLDIHHIDEDKTENIGVKTKNAIESNDDKSILKLKKYNERSRLVYVNKIEHFLIHLLLDLQKPELPSGGTHLIYGTIVQMIIGNFKKTDYRYDIQQRLNDFFDHFTFKEITRLYSQVLFIKGIKTTDCLPLWKLDSFDYDKTKLENLINEIDDNIKELSKLSK